jgi:hypothetical protein
MSGIGPVIGITLLLFLVALTSRRLMTEATRPRPQPIQLRDIADADAASLLAAAHDPSLHPAISSELKAAVLTATALATADRSVDAQWLLREAHALYASRSPEAAEEVAHRTRALFKSALSCAGSADPAQLDPSAAHPPVRG